MEVVDACITTICLSGLEGQSSECESQGGEIGMKVGFVSRE